MTEKDKKSKCVSNGPLVLVCSSVVKGRQESSNKTHRKGMQIAWKLHTSYWHTLSLSHFSSVLFLFIRVHFISFISLFVCLTRSPGNSVECIRSESVTYRDGYFDLIDETFQYYEWTTLVFNVQIRVISLIFISLFLLLFSLLQ